MLPKFSDIQQWDDTKLKCIYKLLFIDNVDPQLNETREDVDFYLIDVDNEFKHRKLKLD